MMIHTTNTSYFRPVIIDSLIEGLNFLSVYAGGRQGLSIRNLRFTGVFMWGPLAEGFFYLCAYFLCLHCTLHSCKVIVDFYQKML